MPESKMPKLFRQAVRYGNIQELWDTPLPQLNGFSPHEMWESDGHLGLTVRRQQVIRAVQALYP